MNRRVLLATIGVSLPIAGCLQDGQAADDPPTTLTDEAIETVGTDCGEGMERAMIQFDDDAVVIEGTIGTETPCYKAVLTSVVLEDETLAIVVGSEAATTDELCAQCLGAVNYEATVSFDGGGPTTVTVTHEGIDGRVDVTTASREQRV